MSSPPSRFALRRGRLPTALRAADKPVWYRTLYWRVALGTLSLIVVLLAAQAALVLWVVGQADRSVLARPPLGLARLIASDLGAALEAEPAADPERLLRESFGSVPQKVFIVFTDGKVITNRRFVVPEAMLAGARRGLADRDDDPPRGGMRMRPRRFPSLRVGGELKGVVVVLPLGGPIEAALATYGPALLGAGALLLVVGTLGVMFFVLAPARRRLGSLERAAAALGAGDTTARAPEGGGDEIAALSAAFNRMAAELEARLGELEQADRVRRQLLADVSHELMTPLTAIRGYLETLSMAGVVRDEATRERYVRDRHRRDPAPGSHHRRPARPGAPRGRRRRDRCRRRGGVVAVRARRPTPWRRHQPARHHADDDDRARRGARARRWPAARTGRAEPGRQRRAPHTRRRTCCAHRVPRGRRRPAARGRHRIQAFRRSTCRWSSTASTRSTRPAPPVRPAAAWAFPSSRPSSNGTADAWRLRRRPGGGARFDSRSAGVDEVKPRTCPTRSRPCFSLTCHGPGGRGHGLPRC